MIGRRLVSALLAAALLLVALVLLAAPAPALASPFDANAPLGGAPHATPAHSNAGSLNPLGSTLSSSSSSSGDDPVAPALSMSMSMAYHVGSKSSKSTKSCKSTKSWRSKGKSSKCTEAQTHSPTAPPTTSPTYSPKAPPTMAPTAPPTAPPTESSVQVSAQCLDGTGTTQDDPCEADVVVVGSGASGLAAAAMLKQAGKSVVVLEAREAGSFGRIEKMDHFGPDIDVGAEFILTDGEDDDAARNPQDVICEMLDEIGAEGTCKYGADDFKLFEMATASGSPMTDGTTTTEATTTTSATSTTAFSTTTTPARELLLYAGDPEAGIGEEGTNALFPTAVDSETPYVHSSAAAGPGGSDHKVTFAVLADGTVRASGWIEGPGWKGSWGVADLGDGLHRNKIVSKVYDENGVLLDAPKFRKVFAGERHSIFLDEDGIAYAAGDNGSGQLCGGKDDSNLPRKIVLGERVVEAATGNKHTLLLTEGGKVYGCGSNNVGQLGLGDDVASRNYPDAGNDLEGIVGIAVGADHSMALNGDGRVYVMGENRTRSTGRGRLCIPGPSNFKVPQLLPEESVVAIAAGRGSIYLLLGEGRIKACGWNEYGELGDGTTSSSAGTFVQLDGMTPTHIYAGPTAYSAFFRTQDGNLYGMGSNEYSQIGVGDNTGSLLPRRVQLDEPFPSSGVVSPSPRHTLFLPTPGATEMPPINSETITAGGAAASTSAATSESETVAMAMAVEDGGATTSEATTSRVTTTAAMIPSGLLFYAGLPRESTGESGDTALVPTAVDEETSYVRTAAGIDFTFAVLADGSVLASGLKSSSYQGQWGVDPEDFDEGITQKNKRVTKVLDESGDEIEAPIFVKVSAGGHYGLEGRHSIFLDVGGVAYATGSNNRGQLCYDGADSNLPQKIVLKDRERVIDVVAGQEHTLLLVEGGRVYGCGSNEYGQLGLGEVFTSKDPDKENGLNGIVAIATGAYHSIAIDGNGRVYVMGSNGGGRLCIPTDTSQVEMLELLPDENVVSISAGHVSSYLLLEDGRIKACGPNNYGELGDGTTTSSPGTFVQLDGISSTPTHVYAGPNSRSAFFQTQDGNLYGMGKNDYGQLGVGRRRETEPIPKKVQFDKAFPSGGIVSSSSEHTLYLAMTETATTTTTTTGTTTMTSGTITTSEPETTTGSTTTSSVTTATSMPVEDSGAPHVWVDYTWYDCIQDDIVTPNELDKNILNEQVVRKIEYRNGDDGYIYVASSHAQPTSSATDRTGDYFKARDVIVTVPLSQFKKSRVAIEFLPDDSAIMSAIESHDMSPAVKGWVEIAVDDSTDFENDLSSLNSNSEFFPAEFFYDALAGKASQGKYIVGYLANRRVEGQFPHGYDDLDDDDLKEALVERIGQFFDATGEAFARNWMNVNHIETGSTLGWGAGDDGLEALQNSFFHDRLHFAGEAIPVNSNDGFGTVPIAVASGKRAASKVIEKTGDEAPPQDSGDKGTPTEEDPPKEEDATQADAPAMTVTLPMELDLSVKGSALDSVNEALLLEALQQALLDECPTNLSNVDGCVVELVDHHEMTTQSRLRRLSHGDVEGLAVEFQMVINAICASSACTEAQDIANRLYNQITEQLMAAIADGSLESNLQVISGGISLLLEAVVESGHVEAAEISISGDESVQDLSNWYPDFSGTNSCKNDGGAPMYMRVTGAFYEPSVEACCERFFSWDYATCAGTKVVGYYPDWGKSELCIDDPETMPDYMRKSPDHWLYGSIEGCCREYYGWDYDNCVRGGA